MTITFRVENGNGILPPKAAIITPDQLGALRDLLAEQSQRLGFPMLATIHETTGDDALDLEARVCHLALAVVRRLQGHRRLSSRPRAPPATARRPPAQPN